MKYTVKAKNLIRCIKRLKGISDSRFWRIKGEAEALTRDGLKAMVSEEDVRRAFTMVEGAYNDKYGMPVPKH